MNSMRRVGGSENIKAMSQEEYEEGVHQCKRKRVYANDDTRRIFEDVKNIFLKGMGKNETKEWGLT